MLLQILVHTPAWVFGLLAMLVLLGALQLRDRRLPLRRVVILPAVMLVLSGAAVLTTFGHGGPAIAAWLAGAMATAGLLQACQAPAKARWDPTSRTFTVPGSWAPMALFLGIFATRYAVGASLALAPALAGQASFALGFAMLYGALSGVFAGRAVQLYKLARIAAPAITIAQGVRTPDALPA